MVEEGVSVIVSAQISGHHSWGFVVRPEPPYRCVDAICDGGSRIVQEVEQVLESKSEGRAGHHDIVTVNHGALTWRALTKKDILSSFECRSVYLGPVRSMQGLKPGVSAPQSSPQFYQSL